MGGAQEHSGGRKSSRRLRESDQSLLQRNPAGLNSRIEFYKEYGEKPENWYPWISQQINIAEDDVVLELGCGSGKLWEEGDWSLESYENIYLSDVSDEMLRKARNNLHNTSPNISYMQIDTHHIPFDDNKFDVIIANHVLHIVDDLEKSLQEIRRVLTDDGALYTTTKSYGNMEGIDQAISRAGVSDSINQVSQFALEHAGASLKGYFSDVQKNTFREIIQIEEIAPIVSFIETKLNLTTSERENLIEHLQKELKRSKAPSNPLEPPLLTFQKRMGLYKATK